MKNKLEKPNCYKCVHRLDVVGSAHSRCNNVKAHVTGNPHGIKNGWFIHPLNFDPVWLEFCNGFSNNPKDKKPEVKHDPLIEIMSIFASVGR